VQDNGRGGDIVPGNGLAGMRERLAVFDAQLRIDAVRGRGTLLTVRVPRAARVPVPVPVPVPAATMTTPDPRGMSGAVEPIPSPT
jgi:two-component system sensor histidine kinase DesK